jgi:hypothetical protein
MLAFTFMAKERVEKRISKSFTLQTDGRVEIDNKYGNIDIAIGPSSQVKMEIVMSASAGSAKKAEEALERINVTINEGNNRISAATTIQSAEGWMSWFRTGNVDMSIHYQLIVPVDVYLELTNKYGNIYVETTHRNLKVDLAYGDLRLGDINANLNLEMAYSDGSVSQIKEGNLKLAYSDLEMEDATSVGMDMKYTDVKAGTFNSLRLVSAYSDFHNNAVEDMTYDGKYDDLHIEELGHFKGQSAYTGIIIGQLDHDGHFDMRYGDLSVSRIRPGFSRIDLNTSYTGVILEFMSGASFSLDAAVNYCDIRHDNLRATENIDKGTSHVLKGSRGNGGGQVYARMNYGELVIQ